MEVKPLLEWQQDLATGIDAMLHAYPGMDPEHTKDTPHRVVHAFAEMMSGCLIDPVTVLQTTFNEASYSQMIVVADMDFVSLCSHHLLPFFGHVHFAYLPDKLLVGLSKIPRLVEVLARRPQIQEKLTDQIATAFQDKLHPKGCGVVVDAWHSCVSIRGVRKTNVRMRTAHLLGEFQEPDVKAEFFAHITGIQR
jgi:GTP cyclohydrolase I